MNERELIRMSAAEIEDFLRQGATLTLATNGPGGYPHLVAMAFVLREGALLMTTYGKAQKAMNLRRDAKAAILLENGARDYNALKGVMIRGQAELLDDPALVYEVRRLIGEKNGSPIPPLAPGAPAPLTKRVVIRFHPAKFASWDHKKLLAAHPGRSAH